MKNQYLTPLISLLLLSLLVTVGVAAQTPQPVTPVPGNPIVIDLDVLSPAPLVSQDVLAPGCELTSAEAGVFQVVCDSDPGTTGIPTIDGELATEGCELETPEVGVFVLDCTPDPLVPAVPMVPGVVTIQTGVGGPPSDIAAQPEVCDGAAESYLEPGMEVVSNVFINLDSLVYYNQDEQTAITVLHVIEANNWRSAILNTFGIKPNNDLVPIAEIALGDVFTVGEQTMCIVLDDKVTLRLWQLDTFAGYWVVETVAFNEPFDLTSAWPKVISDPPNPGMQIVQPAFPILADGVVFRYLMPHYDETASIACDLSAPSYLDVGMEVLIDPERQGYMRPKIGGGDNFGFGFATWELGTGTPLIGSGRREHDDVQDRSPLTILPGVPKGSWWTGSTGESVFGDLIEDELIVAYPEEIMEAAPLFGTVLDGPVCSQESANPLVVSVPILAPPNADRFYTWWYVELSNGQVGWYPETVGSYIWWDGYAVKAFLYYMQPISMMATEPTTCPAPGLFAGQTVQPGAGAMNLRAAPNGDVIGRVDAGQAVSVFDTPTCEGGINWWPTNLGGFIAENDPESGLPLLVPYVAPVVTEEPAQPEPIVTEEPAQPNPVVTQEPPREPQPPAEQPPREPERPTEDPARAPERPTEEPPRPSAPIIAVTANPTTPPR